MTLPQWPFLSLCIPEPILSAKFWVVAAAKCLIVDAFLSIKINDLDNINGLSLMALLGNSALECRHLVADGIRTSIALEVAFWQAVERQAEGQGWREWTEEQLRDKPAEIGRARWLRVAVLEALDGH